MTQEEIYEEITSYKKADGYERVYTNEKILDPKNLAAFLAEHLE